MCSKKPTIFLATLFFLSAFAKVRNCQNILKNSFLFYDLTKTQVGAYNEIAGTAVVNEKNIKDSFVELLFTKDKGLLLYNKIRMPDQDHFITKIIIVKPDNISTIIDESEECLILINNHTEILYRNFMNYFWLAEVSRYYTTRASKVDRQIDFNSPFLDDEHQLLSVKLEQKPNGFVDVTYGIVLNRKQTYEYEMYLERKDNNNIDDFWDTITGQSTSSTSQTTTSSTTSSETQGNNGNTESTTSSEPKSTTTGTNSNQRNNTGHGNSRPHRHYYETTWFIVLLSFIIIVVIAAIAAGVYYVYSKSMMKDTYDIVYDPKGQF
eukprot:GAHX01001601.1.p1 GENE.GAHX01001601.1~~GAHX01001601.1.p1  ORF type:complete len:322 (-),score=52.39 GAHX01001601.1:724-1689(-)